LNSSLKKRKDEEYTIPAPDAYYFKNRSNLLQVDL